MSRVVTAIIVWVIVWTACVLLGALCIAIDTQPLPAIGAFLKEFAVLIGLLTGLFHYFTGRPTFK